MTLDLLAPLLLALLLALAALYFVLRPLFREDGKLVLQDEKMVELLSRKESTLAAIKDLELDYGLGKISQEDFQIFDARLRRQAIHYMQQIERAMPAVDDAALEAEIAAYRQVYDETSDVDEANQPAQQCESCGRPLEAAHRFCPICGSAVAPVIEKTKENVKQTVE